MLYRQIYQLIFDFLDLIDKLTYRQVSKEFKNFHITDLMSFKNYNYLLLLNETILKQHLHTKKLLAPHNTNITQLNFLVHLQELYLSGSDRSSNCSINELTNLRKLTLSNFPSITDLNTLTKLEVLKIYGSNAIDNQSIKELNLSEFACSSYLHVTSFTHMTNLKRLSIQGSDCSVKNDDIRGLDLTYLDISFNTSITDLSFLAKSLKQLIAPDTLINDHTIDCLDLTHLDISGARNVRSIDHMTNLVSLKINNESQISDKSIKKLLNLVELQTRDNKNITDVNHLTKLKILHACRSGITDSGIDKLDLDTLYTCDNKNITKRIPGTQPFHDCDLD